MGIDLPKGKKVLFLVALFLTTIVYSGEMAIMPITYNIYGAFPDNVNAANFIVSGPSLVMFIAALIAPWLIKKLGRKMIIILTCIIFSIGSIFGVVFVTPEWMMFTRVLMGVGEGLIDVVSVSIIAAVFINEEERSKWTGYYMAAMSLCSVVLSYFAGMFAVNTWTDAYKTFYPMVLTTVMVILFIPNLKDIEKIDQADSLAVKKERAGKKEAFGGMFWIFLLDYALATILAGMLNYYGSVYVAENAIGNEAFAGIWSSTWTFAGFFLTLAFGKIFTKLRKATSIPCLILTIAGTLLMCAFPSKVTALIGAVLVGIGIAVYFAYSNTLPYVIVPESRADSAIGITTAVYAGVYFLVTYLVTALMQIMNTQGMVTPVLKTVALFMIVPLVIELLTQKKFNREFPTEE